MLASRQGNLPAKGRKRTTRRTILREVSISETGFNLLNSITDWIGAGRGNGASVGEGVDEALARASVLRQQIRDGSPPGLDANDQGSVADVIYAICRSLMDECLVSPRVVLDDATTIRQFVQAFRWAEDDLEERAVLFCTLTFIAWRAARILGLSREVQRYEAEYIQSFRGSLQWDVAESVFRAAEPVDSSAERQLVGKGPEAIFQTLLYLHGYGEATPRTVRSRAALLYRSLQDTESVLLADLRSFFLGAAALLAGGMARHIGSAGDAEEWATLAQSHFRADANPKPGLGRVVFLRLTLLYERSRCDVVARAARALDQSFSDLGMLEDRVKCRILWAASLKILGQFQEALEVLEPVREIRDRIRPALFGWVLLQSGDLQQICGNESRALEELAEAGRLLQEGKQFTGLADVKVMISCVYRSHGMLNEALQLLQSSCEEHARLGMRSLEASNRMLIAETYLAMGRPREAEREIRRVLPILEEQLMVSDAVVAANILREAVRQQCGDPKSIPERHERLGPKKS
jgi:tetratricopeptide (TPR) repeat protein